MPIAGKISLNSIKNGGSQLANRKRSPSYLHIRLGLTVETITNPRLYRTVTPAEKPERKGKPKQVLSFRSVNKPKTARWRYNRPKPLRSSQIQKLQKVKALEERRIENSFQRSEPLLVSWGGPKIMDHGPLYELSLVQKWGKRDMPARLRRLMTSPTRAPTPTRLRSRNRLWIRG